jgi:hypothetical protein
MMSGNLPDPVFLPIIICTNVSYCSLYYIEMFILEIKLNLFLNHFLKIFYFMYTNCLQLFPCLFVFNWNSTKKKNSRANENDSNESDDETSENESVSTSDSIIEKLKRALKKKKASKWKKSNGGPASNSKRKKKKVNEDVICAKDIEEEDEPDVDNKEEEQRAASKAKATVVRNVPKTVKKTASTSGSKGQELLNRYAKLVANKSSFGKKTNWYTLKFYSLKECSAANYHFVEMELSNDDDPEKLNIWLKAAYI